MKRLEAVIERTAAHIAAQSKHHQSIGRAYADEQGVDSRVVMATVSSIPTVFAGPGMGTTACTVCRREITGGTTEYEMVFESRVIILDRKCFALWQTEQAPN